MMTENMLSAIDDGEFIDDDWVERLLHHFANEIIAETIDAVQDTIVEKLDPAMDIIDRLLGPIDEWLASTLINAWREEVWGHAIQMVENPGEGEREQFRRSIERLTLQRSDKILSAG